MPIAKPVAAALVLLAASANAAPDAPCQVSQRALQGCIATSSVDAGFSCCDELRALRAQGCHRCVLGGAEIRGGWASIPTRGRARPALVVRDHRGGAPRAQRERLSVILGNPQNVSSSIGQDARRLDASAEGGEVGGSVGAGTGRRRREHAGEVAAGSERGRGGRARPRERIKAAFRHTRTGGASRHRCLHIRLRICTAPASHLSRHTSLPASLLLAPTRASSSRKLTSSAFLSRSDRLELAYNSLCAEASAELLQEEIGEDDLISIHAVLSSAGRNDLADSIFEVEHWQDGKGIGTSANESEWSGDELTETYDDEGAEDDTKRTASVSGESERAGLSSHPFPSTFGLLASLHELSDSLLRAVSSRGGAQRAQSKIKGPSSGETRARKGFSLRASLVALKSGCWKAGSRPSGGPSAARAAGRRWGGRWTATASDDATERAHGSARQDSEFGSADALVDGLRSSRSGPCPRAQRRASGGEALRGSHRDSRPESDVSSFSLASMTSLNGGQLVVDDLGGLVGVWGAEEPERVSMAGRLDVSEADLSSALKSEHVRSRAVQRIGNHGDPGSGLSSREGSVDPSLALDETTPGEASSLASSMRRLSTFGNLRAPLSKKHTGRFSHAKPKLAPSGDRRQNAIVDRVARLQSTLKGVGNAGSLLPSSMPSLAKNIMGLGSEDEVESVVDTGIVKRLERNADDLAAALDREASVHGDAIATKVWRTKNGELLALAE